MSYVYIKNKIQERELFKKIKEEIGERRGAHDLSHVLRVLKYSYIINKTEKANLRIVEAMVLLHDVVRFEDSHEKKSMRFSLDKAKEMLTELNYKKKEIERILDGISSHSLHSKYKKKPKTKEAKILFDADKIDAAGYCGIARWLFYCSNMNRTIERAAKLYLQELHTVRAENKDIAYTKTGRKLIGNRIRISERFMTELLRDIL